jgi:hypothetical protein
VNPDTDVLPCCVCGAPVEFLSWSDEVVAFVDHIDGCPIA